jgi:KDO2-lipid IV(A) lauroyltransferase
MRHYAEYVLARAAGAAASILPRSGRLALGRSLGSLVYALDARHRGIALANIDLAFGAGKTPSEKRAIGEGAYRHFGAMLFELATLGKPTREEIEARVDFEGVELLEKAVSRGKGVILVTAHFGNWELHAIAHGYRIGKLHVVVREQANPFLNQWLDRTRKISGNAVIDKSRALRRMRTLLREGESVAVVVDQNVPLEDAVFVDFFGRKAATTPVPAWFALKTGAAIVPAFSYPLPGGRYRAVYEPEIDVEPYRGLDRDLALVALTQKLASVQEARIRKAPELWMWMHRRWRTRPPGEGESELPVREARRESVGEAALT